MVEMFLASVQKSSTEKLTDKVKMDLSSECVDELIAKINQVTNPFKQRIDQIKLKVSFEYPYLQALNNQTKKRKEALTVQDFTNLVDLNHILEITLQNRSSKGCLELFIEVLRRTLHLGLVLRYQSHILTP
jgi:hypothetical protein